MKAKIAVGVEFSLIAEDADLLLANEHDPTIAILEFGSFGDKLFSHGMSFFSGRWAQCAPGWPLSSVSVQNVPALGHKCNQRHSMARRTKCIAASLHCGRSRKKC